MTMKPNYYKFKKALPVWDTSLREEMNISLSFVAELETTGKENDATVSVAVADSYILRVNGETVAYGPARCAKDFFRVDEINILPYLKAGKNIVAIRAAAYNTNSFVVEQTKGFLCAELVVDGKVAAATGDSGFKTYRVCERIQRANRISFQRPFTELYDLSGNAFAYELGADGGAHEVSVSRVENKTFLCRTSPNGDFTKLYPEKLISRGSFTRAQIAENEYFHNRLVDKVNQPNHAKGFTLSELEYTAYRNVSELKFTAPESVNESADSITLLPDTYAIASFSKSETGVFAFDLECKGDGELYLIYDDLLTDNGDVTPFRYTCAAILAFRVKKGAYRVACAEPYGMKHLKLVAVGAEFTVKNLHLMRVAYPKSAITAHFVKDDAEMKMIFDAALETFSANSFDIYTDCPSRERAGWLCDSYFTARTERVLTGKSLVEKDFLENFMLPDVHDGHPKGMIPMLYPGDMMIGQFIPNWAMFYVLELEEYLQRSGDFEFVNGIKEKVYALLDYFRGFENEYGLLENLESWVFVEWSHANKLVQDVSFPSNMLYARFKEAISNLYGDKELFEESEMLRETIHHLSFTGEFFCDNAYRRDGQLVLSEEYTETCQYYAFYFGIATPQSYPELWEKLLRDFGYERRKTGKYPEVHFANAFIGNQLRMDLLCRYGELEILESNIRDYYSYMARTTGTLWEHEDTRASCNHGFASELVVWLKALGYIE